MISKTTRKRPNTPISRKLALRAGVYGTLIPLAIGLLVLPNLVEQAASADWVLGDWLSFMEGPLPKDVKTLTVGEETSALLNGGERDAWFRLHVPFGTVKLKVELESPEQVDLDLYAFDCEERDVRKGTDVFAHSKKIAAHERILVTSPRGALGGQYTLRVSAPLKQEESLGFTLNASAETTQQGPALDFDAWNEVTLRTELGKTTLFTFELEEPANELHVQIEGARTDYNLFVDRIGAPADEWDWEWISTSIFNDEWLVIRESEPLPRGQYKLLVMDSSSAHDESASDDQISLGVFSRTPEPPPAERHVQAPELAGLPPAASRTLVQLRVEDGSGSGVVVSPKGHILTAAHIFDGDDDAENGSDNDFAIVGFVDDPARQPLQTYVAELIHLDHDRDIALAHIVRTVREQQAESAVIHTDFPEFAFLEMALDEVPRLGEPVTALGFPSVSSAQERTFLHLTRGVVTAIVGDHAPPRFAMIDSQIFPGMSGGPVIDSQGRVVGLNSFSRARAWDDGEAAAHYCALLAGCPEALSHPSGTQEAAVAR